MDKKIKILIVDDEELICWSLRRTLEQNEQFAVNCLYTAHDALKDIGENNYDIIITDLRLPDVNGAEFITKIKELINDTPVIVISAYLSHPVMNDFSEYDVFRCINKPFELNEIMCVVKDAIDYSVTGINAVKP